MTSRLLFATLLTPGFVTASAQQVAKRTIVEHFTNTWCSVCAGRNPGFLGNLAANPDVLHVAFYPSAPYSSCPFNQLNKTENDARTNYYGIYGATPRLVVNGAVVPDNTNYADPSIFPAAGLSDYALDIRLRAVSSDTAEAIITLKKTTANSLSQLRLYAVLSEDTVMFNAKNGETTHFDLFHKSLTGTSPELLTAPANAGDSVRKVFRFYVSQNWGPVSVTAILQDTMKNGLQAARSNRIIPTGVAPTICFGHSSLCLYPNPATSVIYVGGLPTGYYNYTIISMLGQPVMSGVLTEPDMPVQVEGLPSGLYIFTLGEGSSVTRTRFVRR